MTQIQKVTLIIVLTAIVALIGYDVFAYAKGGYEATISYLVWTSAHTHPIIPLSAGVLIGHLFFSQTA